MRTFLVSAIGRDALGDGLLSQTVAAGVRCEYVQRTELATGTYTAVLDSDGELVVAVSDMAAVAALGPGPVRVVGREHDPLDADHLRRVQEAWCRRSLRVGCAGVVSPIKSPDVLNA